MFSKLVKHEFKATARIIPLVYLVTIVFALIHIITSKLEISVLSNISMFLTIVMAVAQVIVTIIVLILRYYNSLYGSEGYLSHTLPLRPQKLLFSKLLVDFVWMLASYAISAATLISVLVTDLIKSDNGLSSLSQMYQNFITTNSLSHYQVLLWSLVAAFIVISILQLLTEIFFAITLGTTAKFHSLGIGGPIVVFIAQYMVLQMVNTAAMLLIPLAVKINITPEGSPVFSLVNNNMLKDFINSAGQLDNSVPPAIGIGSFILIPFIICGLLAISAYIINKKTSLR